MFHVKLLIGSRSSLLQAQSTITTESTVAAAVGWVHTIAPVGNTLWFI